MRFVNVTLLFLLIWTQAAGQDCGLSEVLKVAFYDKRVYDKVFIDIKGIENDSFVLPPGKYAFIFPDSVFTNCYPGIYEDLAWSWPREHKVHTMTYIQNDSSVVFVSYYIDSNPLFNILFDEIQISETEARVQFRTSCDCGERTIGTSHRFNVSLVREKAMWRITDLSSKDEVGCRWTYPGTSQKLNSH